VVQHTFQALGVKVVTLTVTGPAGTSNSVAKSYSPATPTAPTAVFTVNPASPSAAASAVYDASASTVGAGARIVNYNWNFGDGTTAVDAGVPIYVRPAGYPVGVFAVTLTVTDDLGRTATKTTAVTVVP
jgi:PKD repeat protein